MINVEEKVQEAPRTVYKALLKKFNNDEKDPDLKRILSEGAKDLLYPDPYNFKVALDKELWKSNDEPYDEGRAICRTANLYICYLHFMHDIDLSAFSSFMPDKVYYKVKPSNKGKKKGTSDIEPKKPRIESTDNIFKENIRTKEEKLDKERSMILPRKKDKGDAEKLIMEHYKDMCRNSFLKYWTNSLFIYDYMERQSFSESQIHSPYEDSHNELYEDIYNILNNDKKNDKLTYLRFLALPIHERYMGYGEKLVGDPELRAHRGVIRYSSFSFFKHIVDTLRLRPEFQTDGHKCGFRILINPTRTYHYALISGNELMPDEPDDSVRFLEELSKYDEYQRCRSDLLNLGSRHNYPKGVDRYYSEMRRLVVERPDNYPKFHLNNMKTLINDVIEDLEKRSNPAKSKRAKTIQYDSELKILNFKRDYFINDKLPENFKSGISSTKK
ncbi:MAG: hypothetical protein RH860_00135 [Cytophagales bacterium]